MNQDARPDKADDADVAALMRAVGPRPSATAHAMAAARSAVEAEWRATVAARERRRRYTGWAAVASVAVVATALWLARPMLQTEPSVVASVTRVVGSVEQNRGDGRWTELDGAGPLTAGTRLRTTANGRAALRLESGVQLRLDSRTLVALVDAHHATLSKGAVYVDSGQPTGAPGPDFELETVAGTVGHLGTQYEARIVDGVLQVGVREGRVRVSGAAGQVVGGSGERLLVTDRNVTRLRLAPTDPAWGWIADVTPPCVIEGQTVESFLIWAARETGRTIVYASPEAARQARSVTLSGTLEGLTPDEAVHAVLSTTSLQPELAAERIRIEATSR